jgi:hypothetical protein
MELFTSTPPKKNMYIHLYRNQPQGSAITGRLVIDGRWFCDTLERKGYQILPLCYHVAVTQSPKFKRLLPIVQNVPNRSGIRFHRGTKPEHSTGCILVVADNKQKGTINNNLNVREAIVRPKGDKNINLNNNNTNYINLNNNNTNNINQQHSAGEQHTPAARSDISNPVGCRSAAEIERELTSLILKAQQDHEEIILEVTSSGLA